MAILDRNVSRRKKPYIERNEVHHNFGKIDFIIATLKKIDAERLFDEAFTIPGHEPDISYGITGMILIANLICSPKPLYKISTMFKGAGNSTFDFKGTFGRDISIEQLHDHRFRNFLDRLHEVGCRLIFSKIMMNAMTAFGIKLTNVNYDTTSKVMWGTFEYSDDQPQSELVIGHGYSKRKRFDKKQIVIGLGISGGFIVDAKVLSGAMDDKTYNFNNLDDFDNLRNRIPSNSTKEPFYTADSSLATADNFKKAASLQIKVLTRLPDNYRLTKEQYEKWQPNWSSGKSINVINENGERRNYRIFEDNGVHDGIPLRTCVYFNHSLMHQKFHTIERGCQKEEEKILTAIEKKSKKAIFSCEPDAQKFIEDFQNTNAKNLKYHNLECKIEHQKVPAPGRRPADESKQKYTSKYKVVLTLTTKPDILTIQFNKLMSECMFMLVSNDLTMTGEEMIKEYKNQSSVEVKFSQLKNQYQPNSLYVKKAERVESLMYLSLIGLQVCSLIECVVRRELEKESEFIWSTAKIKQTRPTFSTIIDLFENVGRIIEYDGEEETVELTKLSEDQKKILRYMDLTEDSLIGVYD